MFGLVSNESFEAQLIALATPRSKAKVVAIERGRGNKKEVPIEVRKLVSTDAINGDKSLGRELGLSEASISAYKHDATSTSTYNEPNSELKKHNNEVREEILDGARGKLLAALENITTEKLEGAKVRDTAAIARDMSAIIKNLEPETSRGNQLNQQIIFYTPKTKTENDFEVVEARE